jgi:uncharacterized protein YcbX
MTGSVTSLWRHPIKSHGRESLDSVTLDAGQTMPWDRVWAVAHEASKTDGSAWAPCANFSIGARAPGLMGINARTDEETGLVTLVHPELEPLTFDPDAEPQRLIDWTRPIMPQNRAASARVVRVPGRGMTDTDYPSVSIGNMATHRAVEQKAGHALSPKRWRLNIWLDGLAPWEEFDWIDRSITIGGVDLKIRDRIQRCKATTANPDTGKRDVDTLGALNTWGHQDMGVYAEVIRGGRISIGDKVQVTA